MDIEQVKKRLEKKKSELLERLQRTGDSLRRADNPPEKDFAEQATERENDDVLEALQHGSKQELLKINKALARIEQGAYFECSNCGEDIPEERLEAVPFTVLCVSCASQRDK